MTARGFCVLAAAWLFVTTAAAADLEALLPEFVTVPAGTFAMGAAVGEPGARGDDRPRHTVTLSVPFRLAVTEVTQALWRAVMDSSTSYFTACGDACPAESLTWFEAIEFCNELSRRLGLEPAYETSDDLVTWNREADGFRLPTEAEWEMACRAGMGTAFHFGPCLGTDVANYDGYQTFARCPAGLFREEPVPVASFRSNAWGLFDMHGNVHEWCWDLEGPYSAEPVIDPTGPETGLRRCLRGGGWISNAAGCRSAIRYFIEPGLRYDFVGFRLARSGGEPDGDRR